MSYMYRLTPEILEDLILYSLFYFSFTVPLNDVLETAIQQLNNEV